MVTATFRFYEELNDFLPLARRGLAFSVACAREATTKHMIEALGVPHTEVELILVNGMSVDFSHHLRNGDRVAVYPRFEAFDISPLLRVRTEPLREVRFLADANLGGLAHLLRMTGFDTRYDNGIADATLEALAVQERRIVLTRDRELLKRRHISHGCYIHALKPALQLHEIFARLDLARLARPFSLCLECNAPLHAIARDEVRERVPPGAWRTYPQFFTCDQCRRVFWQGSHWRHMRRLADEVMGIARVQTEPR